MLSKMDKWGDRYARRNRRWVKISRQDDGRYTIARGYEGDFKCAFGELTVNVGKLTWAKAHADEWLDR